MPCNMVDRPEWCDFQFGSVVNRSPVVIGVLTSGAAPILAQAIRTKLEVLLPPSLQAWAQAAGEARAAVLRLLPASEPRRRFWEHVAAMALSEDAGRGLKDRLLAMAASLAGRRADEGRVTLVGAGPGSADLLTLAAGALAACLIAEGLAPSTPAVAVAALFRPEEARWSGPLASLGQGVGAVGLESPVLIGIGTVFALREAHGRTGDLAATDTARHY